MPLLGVEWGFLFEQGCVSSTSISFHFEPIGSLATRLRVDAELEEGRAVLQKIEVGPGVHMFFFSSSSSLFFFGGGRGGGRLLLLFFLGGGCSKRSLRR